MAVDLNPYLTFQGRAREAMEFYRDALGGELTISTFAEYGDEGNDGVMHANLRTERGMVLMASDLPPGEFHFVPGNEVSVSLSGDEADYLRTCWERLSVGATIVMPLERQMWGDDYGQLTDRFGTQWMVNIAGSAG